MTFAPAISYRPRQGCFDFEGHQIENENPRTSNGSAEGVPNSLVARLACRAAALTQVIDGVISLRDIAFRCADSENAVLEPVVALQLAPHCMALEPRFADSQLRQSQLWRWRRCGWKILRNRRSLCARFFADCFTLFATRVHRSAPNGAAPTTVKKGTAHEVATSMDDFECAGFRLAGPGGVAPAKGQGSIC